MDNASAPSSRRLVRAAHLDSGADFVAAGAAEDDAAASHGAVDPVAAALDALEARLDGRDALLDAMIAAPSAGLPSA